MTPGKHMEAIREGVQDYEYLKMLEVRIAEARREATLDQNTLDAAQALLEGAAGRVIACMTDRDSTYWQRPKDRSVADAVRVEILEMLMKLKGV